MNEIKRSYRAKINIDAINYVGGGLMQTYPWHNSLPYSFIGDKFYTKDKIIWIDQPPSYLMKDLSILSNSPDKIEIKHQIVIKLEGRFWKVDIEHPPNQVPFLLNAIMTLSARTGMNPGDRVTEDSLTVQNFSLVDGIFSTTFVLEILYGGAVNKFDFSWVSEDPSQIYYAIEGTGSNTPVKKDFMFYITDYLTISVICNESNLGIPTCLNVCDPKTQGEICRSIYDESCFNHSVISDLCYNYYNGQKLTSYTEGKLKTYCQTKYKTLDDLRKTNIKRDLEMCSCHMKSGELSDYYDNYKETMDIFRKLPLQQDILCLTSECTNNPSFLPVELECPGSCLNITLVNQGKGIQIDGGFELNIKQSLDCQVYQETYDQRDNPKPNPTPPSDNTGTFVIVVGVSILLIIIIFLVLLGRR